MASSSVLASAALLLAFNLVFFSLVSSHNVPCPPTPSKPSPKPNPSPKPKTCPCDTLKFGVCSGVLGLIDINVGKAPKTPCCSLLEGLTEFEAALCLCTAIKADVLGVNLDVPVSLSLLLNYCGKKAPDGYKCA